MRSPIGPDASTFIHVSAVTDLYDGDDKAVVDYLVNYPIDSLPYTVAFKAGEFFTAVSSRILDKRFDLLQYAFQVRLWDRAQIFIDGVLKDDAKSCHRL